MAYQALYRRYRPQVFADVIGQNQIVQTLQNQIKLGRIAHAYLFCGTRGTGKTTAAKIFARAINCANPQDGEPCGGCVACIGNDGNGGDIIEIDAASNNGVDEIRDLRDKVRFAPMHSKYKVYIIDEVHMLSIGAFNALLKTLEEPPAHAVFILATTEPQKLPATVLSRCQRYEFCRISCEDIILRLQAVLQDAEVSIEHAGLQSIARAAQGGMRDALSIADQCISFCGNDITAAQVLGVLGSMDEEFMTDIAGALIHSNVEYAIQKLDTLMHLGRDLGVFTKDLMEHFRCLMLICTCKHARNLLDCTDESYGIFAKQAESCSAERAIRAISLLGQALGEMKYAGLPRIPLELAFMHICRPQDEKTMVALLDRLDAAQKQSPTAQAPASAQTQGVSEAQFAALQEKIKALETKLAQGVVAASPGAKKPATAAKPAAVFKDASEQERALFAQIVASSKAGIQKMFTQGKWNYRLAGSRFEIFVPHDQRHMLEGLRKIQDACAASVQELLPGAQVQFSDGGAQAAQETTDVGRMANALFGSENVIVK